MQATTNLKPIKCYHLIGETNKTKTSETKTNTNKHTKTSSNSTPLTSIESPCKSTQQRLHKPANDKKWNKKLQTNFYKEVFQK
jgi:Zn-dependent metalloprotease